MIKVAVCLTAGRMMVGPNALPALPNPPGAVAKTMIF
jgi:hypothetical protein